MHFTGYVLTRCHERGRNVVENGFPWQPFNIDAKNGEQSMYPSFNGNHQHLDFNKDVLSQIIQKHEATFRYQLQELHRLYSRQRELMDEMRVRQIYTQHLQFQAPESKLRLPLAHLEVSQTTSHTASWILGNNSDNLSVITAKDVQGPSYFAENSLTNAGSDLLLAKNKYNEAKSLSSRIGNPPLPADVYLDSDEKLNVFKSQEQDSGLGPVKMGDFSTCGLKQGKGNFLIDLNEPILLEEIESTSTTSFEPHASHKEVVMCLDPVSELKSFVSEHACCKNSSIGIDLNLMPLSCSSEAAITVENLLKSNEESKVEDPHDYVLPKLDCNTMVPYSSKNELPCDSGVGSNSSSVHDQGMSEGMLEEHPTLDMNIRDKNIILEQTFPSFSSTKVAMESAEEMDLEAPVSPANKEGFLPRGRSEEFQLVATPLLPEERKREAESELDGIAAETLLLISHSRRHDIKSSNCLCWFADIVSSICDINDLGELRSHGTCDFKIKKPKRSQKVDVNRSRRTGSIRRNAGRNSCSKSKNSKLPHHDNKKSVASTSKDLQTVSWDWGKMQKRRGGGHRRHASKFLAVM